MIPDKRNIQKARALARVRDLPDPVADAVTRFKQAGAGSDNYAAVVMAKHVVDTARLHDVKAPAKKS